MIDRIAAIRLIRAVVVLHLLAQAGCRNWSDALPWPRLARDHAAASDSPNVDESNARESNARESNVNEPASEASPDSAKAAAAASKSSAAPAASDSGAGASGEPSPPSAAPSAKQPDELTRAILSKDAWTVNVTLPGAKPDKARWRYRNPELEELLRTPPDERPRLDELLATKLPVMSANAAIVQVRWRQAEPVETLAATVQRSDLRIVLRQAALEALASIDRPQARDAVKRLLQKYGDAVGEKADGYVPKLHTDLLIAILGWPPKDALPYWTAALKSPDAAVRLATLEVLIDGALPMPPAVPGLREDSDPRIRGAALRVLARHHDPKAIDYLRRALDDFDLSVRLAAIEGLGEIKTAASRAALEKMLRQPGELVRAAAVESLARQGADDCLETAARDKDTHVRQAVARSLAEGNGMVARRPRDAARLASTLVSDNTPDVQRAAVNAVASWPLELAGPILLNALEERGYLARKTAAIQLARRWPTAEDFPSDGPIDQRAVALDALRVAWISQFGPLAAVESRAAIEPPAVTLRRIETQWREGLRRVKLDDQLNHVAWVRDALDRQTPAHVATLESVPAANDATRALLEKLAAATTTSERDAAIASLKHQGAAILPSLDEFVVVDARPLPDAMYRDVLPDVQPVFKILADLETGSVSDRRSAAERLAAFTAQQPLSTLALARVAEILARGADTLVWQSTLAALAPDGREPAERIAAMAIGSDSPEVRRRACEYFARHGDPKHVALLLPLLDDSQLTVVMTAVKALGESGPLADTAPLEALLSRPEKTLRLEVALALGRLQAPAGAAALERLASDVDADARRGAAMAMGALGAEAFVPPLVTLLDDRNDISQAAMASLIKIVGRDVSNDPTEEAPASPRERIDRWRRWHRRQTENAPAAANSPENPPGEPSKVSAEP